MYLRWSRFRVVEAVYEGGVLKPLSRLDLPEGSKLIVVIKPSKSSRGLVEALRRFEVNIPEVEVERFLEERR